MTTPAEPEMVGMREFRENFPKYDRPVRVVTTRGGLRVIGVWRPEPRKLNDKSRG